MNSLILRGAPRVFGAAALFGALLVAPAAATTAPADVVGAACTSDEGVTVVVDFTDSGGNIEVACAEGSPQDGREALEEAGFTAEDSQPGMICAINSSPDPCPEEFDGNFWSYWNAEEGGEWEMYEVGADDAEPIPGNFEGWRYSDGSEGPQVAPAALAADDAEETGDAEIEAPADSDETPTEEATTTEADDEGGSSARVWIGVVAAIAVIGGIIAMVVRRNNQNNQIS